MKIREHFKVDGVLQRSLVTRGNTSYRRIARYTDQLGQLAEGPDAPVWQSLTYDHSRRGCPSVWVNIRSPSDFTDQLEANFQTALAAESAHQPTKTVSEALPVIQSDDDWLDLRVGEKGRVVGKLNCSLRSHATSVMVSCVDRELILVGIPSGYGGNPLEEGTPVDITATRTEDGLECSTTDILPPSTQ